jgi:hypothetical protein
VDPPGQVLEPAGWPHIVDARHCGNALVEPHERLGLVSHPRPLPDGLCVANPLKQSATSLQILEAACGGGTPTDRGDEDEKQHHGYQDGCAAAHVSTIVAASIQLVKVPGVCGPVAQLASRPAVAGSAVTVTLKPRVVTAEAGGPASVCLAQVRVACCCGVAPVAGRHVERRHRGISSTADAWNRVASCAVCCQGIGGWTVVTLITDVALCRAELRVAACLARNTDGLTLLWLILAR